MESEMQIVEMENGTSGNGSGSVPSLPFHSATYIHSPFVTSLLVGVFSVVTFLGVFGNGIIILRFSRIKTRKRIFLLNLAIVDLVFSIFCVQPTLLANIITSWRLGWVLCTLSHYVQNVCACASGYFLLAISLDMLMAVKMKKRMKKSLSIFVVLGIWFFSLFLSIPRGYFFKLVAVDPGNPEFLFCMELWPPGYNEKANFFLVNLGLFYILPFLLTLALSLSLLSKLKGKQYSGVSPEENELTNEPEENPGGNSNSNSSKRQDYDGDTNVSAGSVKLLMVILLCFFFCWLPIHLVFTMAKLTFPPPAPTSAGMKILALAKWFAVLNCSIKPLFYKFSTQNFMGL